MRSCDIGLFCVGVDARAELFKEDFFSQIAEELRRILTSM